MVEHNIPDLVQEVLSETQSPFPISVSTTLPLWNFKMSTIPLYDGKTDLIAHVQTDRTRMNIAKANASILCIHFSLLCLGPSKHGLGGCAQG